MLALPTSFGPAAAGSPAVDNVKQIVIQNTGDAALNITAIGLANSNNQTAVNAVRADETPGDFQVISNTCVGTPLAGALPPSQSSPAGTRSTCVVNVGFKPTRTNAASVARLIVTSNADNATEQVLLTGTSTGEAIAGVGGVVPGTLSLNIGSGASFGSFLPATARTYTTALAAIVVSTAGDALLGVTDPSTTAPGHLVNGSFSLPQALQIRAATAANPSPAYAPLSEVAGTPVNLLSYATPTAGGDTVTLGFSQAIGATDVLRSGSYSKTLTFTLSTTTP
jgi:hypothetical protein